MFTPTLPLPNGSCRRDFTNNFSERQWRASANTLAGGASPTSSMWLYNSPLWTLQQEGLHHHVHPLQWLKSLHRHLQHQCLQCNDLHHFRQARGLHQLLRHWGLLNLCQPLLPKGLANNFILDVYFNYTNYTSMAEDSIMSVPLLWMLWLHEAWSWAPAKRL